MLVLKGLFVLAWSSTAVTLDAELTTMLQEQFMAAFTLFQPVSMLQQVFLRVGDPAPWLLILQLRACCRGRSSQHC
jgi:hypothetical protein